MSTVTISAPVRGRSRPAARPVSPVGALPARSRRTRPVRETRPTPPEPVLSTVAVDGVPIRRRPVATATAPVRSESWGSVRLTRRGRLVVLAVAMAAAFGLFTLASDPAASTRTGHHMVTHTVVVAPGQTLWDIARAAAPGDDPRAMVAQIVDLNDLSSAGDIRAGMPLRLPGA